MNFDTLRHWGKIRGINKKANIKAQTIKLMEEAGELARAVLKEDTENIIDSIGDCVVVLTILADQHKLKIEDCADSAWKVIRDRQGKIINGSFVKD